MFREWILKVLEKYPGLCVFLILIGMIHLMYLQALEDLEWVKAVWTKR